MADDVRCRLHGACPVRQDKWQRFCDPCFRRKDGTATFASRRTASTYHDQAYSNLILDFDREDPARYVSLRSQLAQDDNRLPELDDQRLANTLGVAALIFYRSTGQWTPYMVRRVRRIGVFPSGLHCTASGVAKWPAHSRQLKTLGNFATRHMLSEIEEEVGLGPQDLVELRPLALCREMARGGKPQLLYGGFTLLGRKTLSLRRRNARKFIEATNQLPEIERDRWFRSADVVLTPGELRTRVGKWGLTLEGAAALHFGIRYAEARLPHLNLPE